MCLDTNVLISSDIFKCLDIFYFRIEAMNGKIFGVYIIIANVCFTKEDANY